MLEQGRNAVLWKIKGFHRPAVDDPTNNPQNIAPISANIPRIMTELTNILPSFSKQED